MSCVAGIVPMPCDLVFIIAACVSVALAIVAATRGKLPLGITWQAECPACHFVKFSDKLLAIVPCHLLDGVAGATGITVAVEIARIAAHHGHPQGLRHLGLSDGKWR